MSLTGRTFVVFTISLVCSRSLVLALCLSPSRAFISMVFFISTYFEHSLSCLVDRQQAFVALVSQYSNSIGKTKPILCLPLNFEKKKYCTMRVFMCTEFSFFSILLLLLLFCFRFISLLDDSICQLLLLLCLITIAVSNKSVFFLRARAKEQKSKKRSGNK